MIPINKIKFVLQGREFLIVHINLGYDQSTLYFKVRGVFVSERWRIFLTYVGAQKNGFCDSQDTNGDIIKVYTAVKLWCKEGIP